MSHPSHTCRTSFSHIPPHTYLQLVAVGSFPGPPSFSRYGTGVKSSLMIRKYTYLRKNRVQIRKSRIWFRWVDSWCHVYGHETCIINPRRACAARVTVLSLCVCVSVCVSVCLCVCLHLFSPYRDQAGSSAIPTALAQQGLEKLCGDFA